jgi:hypothetical protein
MRKETDVCRKCGGAKDYTIKSGKRAGKLHTYCRKCLSINQKKSESKNPEYYRAYRAKWWASNPIAKIRAHMRRYGSDEHWYFAKQAEQNELCAICKRPEEQSCKNRLSADHCHKSGKLRGLLCNKCNMALHFLENSGWLEAAEAYLKQYP